MSTVDIREAWSNISIHLIDVVCPFSSIVPLCKQQHRRHISNNEVSADIIALIIPLALAHLAHKLAGENRVLEFVEPGYRL